MATMLLPISFFRCNLQRQIFYHASVTAPTTTAITASATAKTASTTALPPPPPPPPPPLPPPTAPPPPTTTRRRRKKGPRFSEPDYRSSVADFLVDSLEFSKKEALSTSTKFTKWRKSRGTKVCAADFHRKAELVIRFLEQKGFEKPQIRKMVSAAPPILKCKVEATLEPKMNYFLELGFSTSDIADVVSVQFFSIFNYGLDSTIRPAIEALRTVMGSVENLLRVMKGRRLYYFHDIPRHLVQNVSLLQALGIPIESIRKRIFQLCGPLTKKPEILKDIVARAEAKWGVSPCSNTFFYAVEVLCCLNEEKLDSKCRVFESFGWDRSDVVDFFRRVPCCLRMSEGNIKAKLRFYMNELGYDVGFILKRPCLLFYSLEKRVRPRHLVLQILKDRRLVDENLPFFPAVVMTESKFLKQYIQPFEDAVRNLHYIYANSISSSAQ